MTRFILSLCCLALASPRGATANDWISQRDWPQFRGHRASGVAERSYLPLSWNVETHSNVRWKTAIPGLGHASPIVAGERVFIVTAASSDPNPALRVGLYGDIAPVKDESAYEWYLYCLDRSTGRILWKETVARGVPKIKRHTKATHANSTPATDGRHVVVFLGSEGLYCYDVCGRLCWKKDLGLLDSGFFMLPAAQWGFASSPIIYRDMVIVQCDVQKNSFLAALDIRTGRELWRTPRADVPTWSTPTVYEGPTRAELIVNGFKHSGGYDPRTGRELWKLSGGGDIPVPTPVVAHNLIYLASAHGPKAPLCAVRLGASGEITPPADATSTEQVAWYKNRDGTYMQTPLVYRDYLYACKDNGVLSCYDARTGEMLYRERLGGGQTGFTASPVAADGKLYFTSEIGDIYAVQAGPQFEVLATNSMGDVCMATPAISGQFLIVRTKSYVYGIEDSRR
jgi:outer membrane protein assembly factor BamB